MTNAFIVLQTNTLAGRKNAFCATCIAQNAFFLQYYCDERFSTGDERVESALKLPAHTTTRVGTSDFKQNFYQNCYTHRHSPSKTGLSHTLVLTCEYATPTSHIYTQ